MSIKATSSITIADISDGIDGTGISSTKIEYQVGSSGTSAPTGVWSTSVPSTSASSPYLWTRVTYTYNDGRDPEYVYSVGSTPEGIEIGGRNLLLKTKSFGNISSGMDIVPEKYKDLTVRGGVISNTSQEVCQSYFTGFNLNDVYTFSFYAKGSISQLHAFFHGNPGYVQSNGGDGNTRFEITNEWKRYSVTWTLASTGDVSIPKLVLLRTDGSTVGQDIYVCGCKLEKGNKATDWTPAPEDIESATEEAAKVATNYMKFKDNGLTVGNMTASTLGRNVLIDSDSVDIRDGEKVLASYGENITLRHNDIDVFTIKDSELINNAKSDGRFFEKPNETTSTVAIKITIGQTLNTNATYIWHIIERDKYLIFRVSSQYDVNTLYWNSIYPTIITINYYKSSSSAETDDIDVPCLFYDKNAIIDVKVNGSLLIENSGDVEGTIDGSPAVTIGTKNGRHLELDGNEIMAKSDGITPSNLYINASGGHVYINSDTDRSLCLINGSIYTKRKGGSYSGKWIEIIDCFNDSHNTTFGYGNYYESVGNTNIYGYKIQLISKNPISANQDIILDKSICVGGLNTSGAVRNNFQPCDAYNNCKMGYGSYTAQEGKTNIYGHIGINLMTRGNVYSDRTLNKLWSGAWHMMANQSISLSQPVSNQLNGIVLAWSYYTNDSPENSCWQYFFIPKSHVANHSGNGVGMHLLTGSNYGYKYVYVSDRSITGDSINTSTSLTISGVRINNTIFVLRYVYGV